MRVVTPLQESVVTAAQAAGYTGSSSEILAQVYAFCASNDPNDAYATMTEYSDGQILELKTWLTLCPTHPQAAKWQAGIEESAKARAAESAGTRVYDGTYKVPEQIQRGTFVVVNVKNCYWETRDAKGNILDNNFVVAAPRVEATIGPKAVVFTAEGCGQWNRQ